MLLMRAATPAGPGPTCRLCWMYLFGLTYANGTGSLVSSDFRRSTTCCLGLGKRRCVSDVLVRLLGTEGVLFRELHARVCGPSHQSPAVHDREYNESPPASDQQSSRCTGRG